MTEVENIYHAADLNAAVKRANEIKGCVIRSKGPESKGLQNEVGFWSGTDRFTRNWEQMVFDAAWSLKKRKAAMVEAVRMYVS